MTGWKGWSRVGLATLLIVSLVALSGNAASQCDAAYPGVCIPSPPPDLDCKDVEYRNFQVLPPDPHRFDRDQDGIGCETQR